MDIASIVLTIVVLTIPFYFSGIVVAVALTLYSGSDRSDLRTHATSLAPLPAACWLFSC